jgi:hypothetical protein
MDRIPTQQRSLKSAGYLPHTIRLWGLGCVDAGQCGAAQGCLRGWHTAGQLVHSFGSLVCQQGNCRGWLQDAGQLSNRDVHKTRVSCTDVACPPTGVSDTLYKLLIPSLKPCRWIRSTSSPSLRRNKSGELPHPSHTNSQLSDIVMSPNHRFLGGAGVMMVTSVVLAAAATVTQSVPCSVPTQAAAVDKTPIGVS